MTFITSAAAHSTPRVASASQRPRAPLFRRWMRNWRERRILATQEPHRLSDMGLSADQARDLWSRPFWRD